MDFLCFLRIKEKPKYLKVYLLGILVYTIKYTETYTKHYLLGIPLFRYTNTHLLKINIDTNNFSPLDINDKQLFQQLKTLGRFTYIPNPGNLGDMLIAASSLLFFQKYKLPYVLYRNTNNFDIIVYGGGGIWTEDYQASWIKVLEIFQKAKKVIILPSSFYKCDKLLDIMDERFTIFCREKQSYNYLTQKPTKAKIFLDHDMALRLSKNIFSLKQINISPEDQHLMQIIRKNYKPTSEVGIFLRQDCEQNQNHQTDFDISAYGGGNNKSNSEHIFYTALLMLKMVNQVKTVITDRLHVGISAILMGKEVYLLDNSYGKISAVYKHSLSRYPNVHFCKTFPNIIPKE